MPLASEEEKIYNDAYYNAIMTCSSAYAEGVALEALQRFQKEKQKRKEVIKDQQFQRPTLPYLNS